MIFVNITLIQGRSAGQKADLFRELTYAVTSVLEVHPASVRMAIDEIPPHHFAIGGVAKSSHAGGPAAQPSPDSFTGN